MFITTLKKFVTMQLYLTDMKLTFIEEESTLFVAALNGQKYKNKFYEELLYAEIVPSGDTGALLKWNDDFFNPVPFTSVGEAKKFAINHHFQHAPTSNGKEWL